MYDTILILAERVSMPSRRAHNNNCYVNVCRLNSVPISQLEVLYMYVGCNIIQTCYRMEYSEWPK